MRVDGSVVVVTGAGAGIGAAMCHSFAAEGARTIVAVDRDRGSAEDVATAVNGTAVHADMTDEGAVARLVAEVEAEHGRIDLFCSNAGVGEAGGVELSSEVWQRTWDVNVMAHVYAARAVLPGMLARGRGYLLQTVSAAGLLTNLGAAPYSVTKHAALGLAEWLSVTYGSSGIGVSCLCPQFVDTALVDALAPQDRTRAWAEATMLTPDEVAAEVISGLAEESFLILPHAEVLDYFRRKADDYDSWLTGMRRLQDSVLPTVPDPSSSGT
jgi:NAD(P)-dependent dehydrogenase (short-subunit alcohol dehydrogenase family)